MRNDLKKWMAFLLAFCTIFCVLITANAETLPLGPKREFAIDTMADWKYYTPDSDLSDVATTAGYLFESSDKYVCYVTSENNSAIICYYPTESNNGLSGRDKLLRCIQNAYGSQAGIFDDAIIIMPLGNGFLFSQETEFLGEAWETATAFVFYKNGMVEISANGNKEDDPLSIVNELVYSLMSKDSNPFAE